MILLIIIFSTTQKLNDSFIILFLIFRFGDLYFFFLALLLNFGADATQ